VRAVTTAEIAAAVDGVLLGDGSLLVENFSFDSREISENCLFVPLLGEHTDGHRFIGKAFENGAAATFCASACVPKDAEADRTYIVVDDTLLALRDLAIWYRRQFEIPMVQITGSVGKTTTKEMVASVLEQHYRTHRTSGNFNNHIGVPLTLLAMQDDAEAAVIESGMNHFGEIRYLGEMIRPSVALITNVGDAHIEFLGSREGILHAKCEIFENLQADGLAVLSGDDELLAGLQLPFRTVLCGMSEKCQYRVTEIDDHGVAGIDCTLFTPADVYRLHIPSPGVHMIYPAAMAAAVGEHLGLSKEEIIRGIQSYSPAGSRMRVIRGSSGRIILDDCYNANPQSMAAALEILAKEKNTVAILGDMGELGELSPSAHREIGALVKRLGIGMLIAVGEKSREMAEGAAGMNVHWFPTVEETMERLPDLIDADGTVIEVKASHAMQFERIVETLKKLP